ncbi:MULTISPECIES: YdiY family protein [Halomonadaceae]|uniref:DUF481 domain-containing protein n=1 Tax=Halomonadaceae TaxID=28256 RepID=UPI00159A58A9|nr:MULTISPECIES: DUF481 domain-containing protein [Halomonas]QJQ95071.1 DUF481 domain-containing protein [Halomonas sp. PA5]
MPRQLPVWLAGWVIALVPLAALGRPFYSPPAPAEDAAIFSGNAELGYTRLSGNTDSQTLIAKGNLTWLTGRWTHSLRGEVRHVANNEGTTAERYLGSLRERYELEGPHYLFGFARWERDRFSGYDRQLTAIGGYGRQVIDTDSQQLSLEAGPGYRHDVVRDDDNEDQAVAYGALDYRWEFSPIASLAQQLSVEATDDNITSRSYSALTARLNSRLALRLSHEIRHDSQPPDTADYSTDHTTSASLVYNW